MNQKGKLVIVFIILMESLVAENVNIFDRIYNGVYPTFNVYLGQNGTIKINHDEESFNQELNYHILYENGLAFIYLDSPLLGRIVNERDNSSRKILFLAGRNAETDGEHVDTYFLGYTSLFYPDPLIRNASRSFEEGSYRIYKDATSYLIEKNKSYPVENLCSYDIDTPWVENAPGYGIGEGFTIENTWDDLYTTLLIMNGYISYEKPYLYEQNGRIKKIRVTGIKSVKSQVLTVLDTPHPQTVDISFITEAEDLRVTIEDVYPGTKYEDTCIQYLVTWKKTVIPYENQIEFSKGK